jgi:hypothetical protein
MITQDARPLRVEPLEDRAVPDAADDAPVLPRIDGVMQAHLREVYARGQALGNRPDVFAKIGDSNTAFPEFLTDLGKPGYDAGANGLADRPDLVATWAAYFRTPVEPSGVNSFNRTSLAARTAWQSAQTRATSLAEVDAVRPAVAVVMVGTNDAGGPNDIPAFAAEVAALVTRLLDRGVIPVLSTIPDLLIQDGLLADRPAAYNRAILELGDRLNVPVWNFWKQTHPLPNAGLRDDDLHLSIAPAGPGRFLPGDLQYGANVRNRTTLEVLAHVRGVVFAGGLPDGYAVPAATDWVPVEPGRTVLAVGADVGGPPEVRVYEAGANRFLASLVPYEPTFLGGVRVAVGDVDGDGAADVVTAPGAGGGPLVKVFSGRDGRLLRSWYVYEPSFRGGAHPAVGDVDADGFADVAVGAGTGGGPRVTVYSGKDGAVLADFFAYEPTFRGGVRVAVAGGQVVTGAGDGGGSTVRAFDPRTGETKLSFFAGDPGLRGGVYVAAGDVTGDGVADVVTGAGAGGGPQVMVFDGRSGEAVTSEFAFDPGARTGVRVAVAGGAVVAGQGPLGRGEVRTLRGAGDPFAPFDDFRGGVFVGAG